MSIFSPVGLQSSSCMNACVFVCVCMYVFVCVYVCVDGMNLTYMLRWHIHGSVHSMLCTQAHTRHSLKPFKDNEPTGLKVDIAKSWLFAVMRPACCGGSPMSAEALNQGVSNFGQLITSSTELCLSTALLVTYTVFNKIWTICCICLFVLSFYFVYYKIWSYTVFFICRLHS